jgi:hypothetical protein
MRRQDLSTGTIVHRWMLLEIDHVKDYFYNNKPHYVPYWRCRCLCGNEKIVCGNSLARGYNKSCGCWNKTQLAKRNWKPFQHTAIHSVFVHYIASAQERGISWNLTKEQFKEITSKNCWYCGKEPSNNQNLKDVNGQYVYSGIDRVDNTIGYEIDNVVPCCKNCNYKKSDSSIQDIINIKNGIEKFLSLKQCNDYNI